MQLKQRISAFAKLGDFLRQFLNEVRLNTTEDQSQENPGNYKSDFKACLLAAKNQNAWFTPDNLDLALEGWAESLTKQNLDRWLEKYPQFHKSETLRRVAVVMAGNLPLVGFHDFLSILISGNCCIAKLSSNDRLLLPYLSKVLIDIEPAFKDRIIFTEERLPTHDAVIATGSNNTSRYFEYYFRDKPHIIRKNRNGVAILMGEETPAELEGLSKDIFSFFGMGCRSVSKMYVPKEYDFKHFFEGVFAQAPIVNNHKYANNYDYNKAVYLMSQLPILDNGFMILKEDQSFSSPIAVVFYERYTDLKTLESHLKSVDEQIQCIVGNAAIEGIIPLGLAQKPRLWDYADGIDTLLFLSKL